MLCVSIPSDASIQILETRAAVLNGLLGLIDPNLALWEAADDVIDASSPAGSLWTDLEKTKGGMGDFQ
jgi:Family of unknown function (DUF6308)